MIKKIKLPKNKTKTTVKDYDPNDSTTHIKVVGETKFPEVFYNDDILDNYKRLEQDDIEYAFFEDVILDELRDYVDKTYSQHYAQDKYQAMDIITDAGYGLGFTLGNVIKYAKRYGKKQGFNRDDLLKMIHYGMLALAVHDLEKGDNAKK